MTPENLAARHPLLFHITAPDAWPSISRHGLLPTAELLNVFDADPARARQRRPTEQRLDHPRQGTATLSDNSPLSEAALRTCLDDSLAPADWLEILNARVFFWSDRAGLARLLTARANRSRTRAILVVDTLSLARAYAERIELSRINSGATIRRAARRGLTTFVPLADHTGRLPILEVVVRGGITDIARHVVSVERTDPATAPPADFHAPINKARPSPTR